MTDFDDTRWADPAFAREYRDNADVYIVERGRMLEILQSFYRHFIGTGRNSRILDLGCGDGILTSRLYETDPQVSATLIDASGYMLDRARERLKGMDSARYSQKSFQDLISGGIPGSGYDAAVSSQAIHHLTLKDKRSLFRRIHECLRKGGYFLNIDVVVAREEAVETWYMKLWQEWMEQKMKALKRDDLSFDDLMKRYKAGEENRPDTLEDQLNALRDTGFYSVDCYYKYGIFAIYGGRKEQS